MTAKADGARTRRLEIGTREWGRHQAGKGEEWTEYRKGALRGLLSNFGHGIVETQAIPSIVKGPAVFGSTRGVSSIARV